MGTGASLAHLVHEASVADLELAIADLGVAQRERLAQILSGPEDSYSKIEGTRFEDVLRRSSMVAIKSSYFRDCLDKGEPFKDRSNIPPESVFSGEEVVDYWKRFGNAFLVIVSYSWLSKRHPDPEMFHLARLVCVLECYHELMFNSRDFVPPSDNRPGCLGVILDYCSLWQNLSEKDGSDSRTPEQYEDFKRGLMCINTPYAHQECTALKLVETPHAEKRGQSEGVHHTRYFILLRIGLGVDPRNNVCSG